MGATKSSYEENISTTLPPYTHSTRTSTGGTAINQRIHAMRHDDERVFIVINGTFGETSLVARWGNGDHAIGGLKIERLRG